MSAAKLNIDELEAGYPLFCKALRLLILKGNSVKDIEKTVCWGHLETLNRCLPSRYKAPKYLMRNSVEGIVYLVLNKEFNVE